MAAPGVQTFSIERRLTKAQAARRDRVRDAARDLADEGGYAAVTMDAVAERSGVARATIYRYFASKDHLLAEVTVAWSIELAESLRDQIRGATPAERVAGLFRRILEHAFERPRLTGAIVTSTISSDPAALRTQQALAEIIPGFLEIAIGDAPVERLPEIGSVFAHVLFSALVNATTGRLPQQEAIASVETAVALLFPDSKAP